MTSTKQRFLPHRNCVIALAIACFFAICGITLAVDDVQIVKDADAPPEAKTEDMSKTVRLEVQSVNTAIVFDIKTGRKIATLTQPDVAGGKTRIVT